MQQGRTHIEVCGVTAQPQDNVAVDGDSHQRGDHHDAALHRLRSGQPADRLVADGQHDHDQGRRVEQRRQNRRALVAVAAALVGGAPGLLDREPGQAEGENIDQHMAGVGEKGQRVGRQAARELHEEHDKSERECPLQAYLATGRSLHQLIVPTGLKFLSKTRRRHPTCFCAQKEETRPE